MKRMLLAALLAIAGVSTAAMLTAPSEAAPGKNCSYYSDASHSTLVGRYGYDCCNNAVAWGTKTSYSECGGCFMCVPPPP